MKLRLPTWWWGKYILKRGGSWYNQDNHFYAHSIDESCFTEYCEVTHGVGLLPRVYEISKTIQA